MEYMTANEAGAKWGVTGRRVMVLCKEGRIKGAALFGSSWAIPKDSQKPADARIKSGKYIKVKTDEIKVR